MRLVLASASPRRAELLRAAGFDFEVHAAAVDESIGPAETARAYVARLAAAKAAEAARFHPEAVVIGADTAVVVGRDIFGKPSDRNDARRMLLRLTDRSHRVVTAVSVRRGVRRAEVVEETRVKMSAIDEQDLQWYLGTGEWRDKAGAYAIQGGASRFVLGVTGSYSNVVGLPIAQLHRILKSLERADL